MPLSAGTAFVDVQPKLGAGFQGAIASRLGPIGVAGGVALAGGLAAGIGGATALKSIGDTFDEAFDTIRVGTGATGEALAGLQSDFKAVLTSVPADAQTAAAAIADLNTRTGLTGETLQAAATQILELGRITGEDTSTLIEKGTRAFGDWGIAVDDSQAAIDGIFRASQATGPPVSQLLDLIVRYGAPLRQFGFGFEESAALLGKFEKEGVNTELVMGSLRIALGNLARSGKEPAEEFPKLIEQIQNTGSSAEANALAMDLFGARAGPDMAAAIREGRFEIGELFDQVAGGEETVLGAADATSDYRESWEKLKNRVFVALEPLATRFLETLGDLFDFLADNAGPVIEGFAGALGFLKDLFSGVGDSASGVGDTISGLAETFRSVFEFISTVVGALFGGVRDTIAQNGGEIRGIMDSIKNAFSSVFEFAQMIFGALQAFWDQWGSTIVALFQNAIGTVVGVLRGAFQIIEGIFDVVLGILTGDWKRAWEGIKSIFSGIWKVITSIFRGIIGQVLAVARGFMSNFGDTIKGGLNTVLGFFRELPRKIVGFLAGLPGVMLRLGRDLIAGLIRGLGNIVSAVGNKIKSGISSAINGVKRFFGIGSPSKVFAAEIGLPIAQGVAIGAGKAGPMTADNLVHGLENAAQRVKRRLPDFPSPDRGTLPGGAIMAASAFPGAGLADAGGFSIIVEDGAIEVHNPIPEEASESIPRELRRLAASLGRA